MFPAAKNTEKTSREITALPQLFQHEDIISLLHVLLLGERRPAGGLGCS